MRQAPLVQAFEGKLRGIDIGQLLGFSVADPGSGSPYLGTIVKGNGEGVRLMPPSATRSLFDGLQALGAGLARDGRLDPEVLARIANPERFPAYLDPVFRLFMRLPAAHSYFDGMLKKNGAYERRFARPFVE